MTMCTCLVQSGQISDESQAVLKAKIDAFAQNHFGSAAQFRWVEIENGNGFTAAKPSTSSLVTLTAHEPLDQAARVQMLHELSDLWASETGASLDEFVGVIADPVSN